MRAKLGDKLRAKLGAKFGIKLRAKFGTKFGTKLGAKLGTKLGAKLGTKFGTKLGTKLRTKLGTKLGANRLFILVSIANIGLVSFRFMSFSEMNLELVIQTQKNIIRPYLVKSMEWFGP